MCVKYIAEKALRLCTKCINVWRGLLMLLTAQDDVRVCLCASVCEEGREHRAAFCHNTIRSIIANHLS